MGGASRPQSCVAVNCKLLQLQCEVVCSSVVLSTTDPCGFFFIVARISSHLPLLPKKKKKTHHSPRNLSNSWSARNNAAEGAKRDRHELKVLLCKRNADDGQSTDNSGEDLAQE